MDNRRRIVSVNASLQGSLADIRTVESFANENTERDKFSHSNQLLLQSKTNNYYRMGLSYAGNNLFQGMLYLTILVAGRYFIANGTLGPISLATYALYINIFAAPVEALVKLTEIFQKGCSGSKRFLEVVETEPGIQDALDVQELKNVQDVIDYDHVTFSYNEEEYVLDDISICIEVGRSIALVGPGGGGRTTICSLLPRFRDVKNGAVRANSQDTRTLTLESPRRTIGIVQQDAYLFTGNIKESITYGGPGYTDEEIIETAKKANIRDFIMGLPDSYDAYVDERGTRLLGGQKQRTGITCVFLKDPRILIPGKAIDTLGNESERYIQESLEEPAKNRTCIVIVHHLPTICNANEIIVTFESGMEERGVHSELLAESGAYVRYYHMQFEGLDPDEQTREILHSR